MAAPGAFFMRIVTSPGSSKTLAGLEIFRTFSNTYLTPVFKIENIGCLVNPDCVWARRPGLAPTLVPRATGSTEGVVHALFILNSSSDRERTHGVQAAEGAMTGLKCDLGKSAKWMVWHSMKAGVSNYRLVLPR
jgi:hypothetical protein